MKHSDFRLGCEFATGSGKKWRCTDIGQRVIVAVCLDDHLDDESWYNGPPYAVAEQVFDEYDQEDCDLHHAFTCIRYIAFVTMPGGPHRHNRSNRAGLVAA